MNKGPFKFLHLLIFCEYGKNDTFACLILDLFLFIRSRRHSVSQNTFTVYANYMVNYNSTLTVKITVVFPNIVSARFRFKFEFFAMVDIIVAM